MSLPIELTIDKYHPSNSEYVKNINLCKRLLVTAQAQCRPRDIEIAKQHIKGAQSKDIADNLDISRNMIYSTLRRPEVQELIEQMYHYQALQDGPSIALRKRELWEMHIDNKQEDPKTSISAIKEINHMEGVGREKNIDREININIINQLPKGALDQ